MYLWIRKLTENRQQLARTGRIVRLLPSPLIKFLCCLTGCLACLLANSFRKQVSQNMSGIMKDQSRLFITRCCLRYFINIPITIYEILNASRLLDKSSDRLFEAEGESNLKEALNLGRGVILYAPHLGNFFYYYWYLSQKYSCLTVVTAGSPELRPLYLIFQEMGCSGLDYDSTPPLELLRTLRTHLKENGVVLLLGDFWRPSFPPAVLLGQKSRSPGGTAALALESRVPVVPFYGRRTSGFRHKLVFEAPVLLYENHQRNQRLEATNTLNRFLDRAILQAPDQWFYWFNAHERWEEDITGMERSGGATVA